MTTNRLHVIFYLYRYTSWKTLKHAGEAPDFNLSIESIKKLPLWQYGTRIEGPVRIFSINPMEHRSGIIKGFMTPIWQLV